MFDGAGIQFQRESRRFFYGLCDGSVSRLEGGSSFSNEEGGDDIRQPGGEQPEVQFVWAVEGVDGSNKKSGFQARSLDIKAGRQGRHQVIGADADLAKLCLWRHGRTAARGEFGFDGDPYLSIDLGSVHPDALPVDESDYR
ncbi:hypothetical protein [Caulobacter endophyticus]|uniref:hypothetical protein n=1 Tax=Caulobacter endophyticus TaxID=2172652 RepID=UPI00130494B3|nr:hypothetical protein [Caulobacter endophyticus]